MPPDAPPLAFDKVRASIGGREIWRDVSFTLAQAQIIGLTGPSGAGKSLLALSAIALAPASADLTGAVRYRGEDLLRAPERRRDALRAGALSMIFQEPALALNPLHRIGDQIAEAIALSGAGRKEAHSRARDWLERVGLPPSRIRPRAFPHELSGGERQRVAIAIAMAAQPDVLIADEPTASLDAVARADILRLIKELCHRSGAAALLISHDDEAIAAIADETYRLEAGRLTRNAAAQVRPPRVASRRPDNAATPPLLRLRAVSASYGAGGRRKEAITDVSLAVGPRETLAIVGASGSGKSTLAKVAVGLHAPDAGAVLVHGAPFPPRRHEERGARRRIQIVFQDPATSLNPRRRAGWIVAEPLHLWPEALSREARRERVADAFRSVGLEPNMMTRWPHQFSGGQRQRLAIARALIAEPEIIVLDEAVSALDAGTRDRILALLRSLAQKRGVGYLFISHDLRVVSQIADRVAVMEAGRIVEQGSPTQILDNPQTRAGRALREAAIAMSRKETTP